MKYLYNFELFLALLSDAEKEGYDEISQDAFNAIFETQSTNSGSGLYLRKNGTAIELVRRNGNDLSQVADLKDIVWVDGAYLPTRPSEAHEWNGKTWVVDADVESELLVSLKADLCAKIDIEAMRVGDLQVKSSIYLSEEYRLNSADAIEWKKTGYAGEPPNSIKQGALSHGISDKEECDLILVAAANSDALIAELRFWRMSNKGVNGINGAKNAEEAQKIHDEAITCLNNRVNDILGK